MGYTTYFSGEFEVGPEPLNADQIAYIQAFSYGRRVARDVTKLPADPIREAVGLPVGFEGAFFVGNATDGNFGQNDDGSVIDGNRAPGAGGFTFTPSYKRLDATGGQESQPGLWCQWTTDDAGTKILWDEGEKFYDYIEWLEYIMRHFLSPWGKTLSGEIHWDGEESGDIGAIRCTPSAVGDGTLIEVLVPSGDMRVTGSAVV